MGRSWLSEPDDYLSLSASTGPCRQHPEWTLSTATASSSIRMDDRRWVIPTTRNSATFRLYSAGTLFWKTLHGVGGLTLLSFRGLRSYLKFMRAGARFRRLLFPCCFQYTAAQRHRLCNPRAQRNGYPLLQNFCGDHEGTVALSRRYRLVSTFADRF
jgi:hypothetical protein